jgi:hypothetical protein
MPDLSSLGASTLGVWTRTQASELVSRGRIGSLVDSGAWQRVFRGVYADGGYELSAQQRAFAAVLATGGSARPVPFRERPDGSRTGRLLAVACGRTAARVWGMPLIDDDDPATGGNERYVHDVHTWRGLGVSVLPAVLGEPRGHELRRHRLVLLDGDLVQHRSGLWLTAPVRTALDCVALLGHEAAVCVLDDGLHRGLFSRATLTAALRSREGWPGVRALTAAVLAADGRAESPNETVARLLLLPVLPELVPQVELRSREGRLVARFDLGDEAVRLAVDMDGKRGHAGTAMVAKDRARDRRTEPYGWWTERGTWWDVRRQREQFRARVVARHAGLRNRAA